MARLSEANVADRPGDHRPLPAAEVGAHPAPPPRPGAGRPRHGRRHGPHGRAARHHARPRSTARPPSTRCSSSSPSAATASTSAPTSPASSSGRGSCSSTPRSASASRPAARPRTGSSPWRTSSASPRAPRRPPSRSTTASATRSRADDFDQLIDDLRAGRLADEIPPHGTLARVRQKVAGRPLGGHRHRRAGKGGRPMSERMGAHSRSWPIRPHGCGECRHERTEGR